MQDGNIVLGAGIAGLGAWYADQDMKIYEAEAEAGGLCGTFEVQGFHFDKAVHLSFSKIDLVKTLFSQTDHYVHHPVPKSWYHTVWMQHPAQNNLYPLSAEEKVKAVLGFINRDCGSECCNFKDWNRSRYGDYLWENFFEPYNRKYWDTDLERLGTGWIGNRIYQPSLEEILYGSYTDGTPNTYYAPEMRYPKQGGYYSFIKPVVRDAEKQKKIHYGYKAVKINAGSHIVYFENGESRRYDKLFSSVPMPVMVGMTEDLSGGVKRDCSLEWTRVAVVSLGLKKCDFRQMWFYIYDSDIMASRAYMPSVKSPENAPAGCASIQFEVYFNAGKEYPDEQKVISNCIYALEKLQISGRDEVLFSDYRVLPFGNVIQKNGDRNFTGRILEWMRERNIYPIGRFGRWEYLWSDQSFLSGYSEV